MPPIPRDRHVRPSATWIIATVLPVFFVVCVSGSIWGIYLRFHIANLQTPLVSAPTKVALSLEHGAGVIPISTVEEFSEVERAALTYQAFFGGELPPEALEAALPPATLRNDAVNAARRERGSRQACISQVLTLLFVICYLRTALTHPGAVPDAYRADCQTELTSEPAASRGHMLPPLYEVKLDGTPRFCKWCRCFKPDRSHHCRACGACVLRMDHHCPWVANCIGFKNHKFFFLLVMYAWLTTAYCAVTMLESLDEVFNMRMSTFTQRFALVFGTTLCSIALLLLSTFGGFHVWLMCNGATTIEFCEKASKDGSCKGKASMYDIGFASNIRAVLGECVLTWFLPVNAPEGDGVSFPVRGKKPGVHSLAIQRLQQRLQGSALSASHLETIGDEGEEDDGTDDSDEDLENVPRPPSPYQEQAPPEVEEQEAPPKEEALHHLHFRETAAPPPRGGEESAQLRGQRGGCRMG